MNALGAAAITVLVIALALILGVVLRRASSGRVRVVAGGDAVVLPGVEADGSGPTLVQFSTPYCAQCPGTRRLLAQVAGQRGIRHHEIDLTEHPELAGRLRIRQTPTVLVLDADGREHARIGGAPKRDTVLAALAAPDTRDAPDPRDIPGSRDTDQTRSTP